MSVFLTIDFPAHRIDFWRSFLRFATIRVNHTHRLQLDAIYTFLHAEGYSERYFPSCTCIGEAMYVPNGLIHESIFEFNIILSLEKEGLVFKRYGNAGEDVRHAFGLEKPYLPVRIKGPRSANSVRQR